MKNKNLERLITLLLFFLVITLSIIVTRFFELVIFCLIYNAMSNSFKTRFHADTLTDSAMKAVFWCKLITFLVATIFILNSTSITLSLYTCLFEIIFIALFSCLLQQWYEYMFPKYLNEEQMRERCKLYELREDAIEMLVLRVCKNKPIKEIAIIMGIEEESVKHNLRRNKKKIKLK